jgi:hypothetical protein
VLLLNFGLAAALEQLSPCWGRFAEMKKAAN